MERTSRWRFGLATLMAALALIGAGSAFALESHLTGGGPHGLPLPVWFAPITIVLLVWTAKILSD